MQAAACWPRHSVSTLPLAALGNVIPKVARTWSTLSGEALLLSEVDWSNWIKGIALQSQVTPTPMALAIPQSHHGYF